ncbi:MAG: hypothetical protein JO345_11340, partial [Streptosporangiaceae bacterium]|nr:hypothetical protein [Streptosporangiaceae bacterium]
MGSGSGRSGSGPLVIVGDALLDRDVEGRATRLCPDAPVPVVEEATARLRPGGAALAAALAATAESAGEVVLIAPIGTDAASTSLLAALPDSVSVIRLPLNGPLQEKTRIRAAGQTLVRVDRPAGVLEPVTAAGGAAGGGTAGGGAGAAAGA